jgi:hypothetical protein
MKLHSFKEAKLIDISLLSLYFIKLKIRDNKGKEKEK